MVYCILEDPSDICRGCRPRPCALNSLSPSGSHEVGFCRMSKHPFYCLADSIWVSRFNCNSTSCLSQKGANFVDVACHYRSATREIFENLDRRCLPRSFERSSANVCRANVARDKAILGCAYELDGGRDVKLFCNFPKPTLFRSSS